MTLQFEYKGLRKIVSGGQTGADQGGLYAAERFGLRTGGFAPSGWKTCRGPNPMLSGYGLICLASPDYNVRTAANIRDSDGTIVIAQDMASPGTIFTINECKRQNKPCHRVYVDEHIHDDFHELTYEAARFIASHQIVTLNVAGNRDRADITVMHDITQLFLYEVFTILKVDSLVDG